ncbi:MAG: ribonuclease R [Candidatus Cloacimonadota bacterium]|nr:ribonuclease R [Candidatus Cloacimonadota bacterium]
MLKKNISSKVLIYLQKNSKKQYSFKRLAKTFHIRKKMEISLKKILKQLERKNQIIKKNGKYSSFHTAQKTVYGTFDARALTNDYSFAYVKCNSTEIGDIKIYRENCLNAYHGDMVEVVLIKSKQKSKLGKIVEIIERKQDSIIGNISLASNDIVLVPDEKNMDTLIDVKNDGIHFNDLKNKKVIVRITNWGDRVNFIPPVGEITEILGDSDDPKIDYLAVVRQFGLSEKFSEEVIQETKNLHYKISKDEITKRKDFRRLTTFTVDPVDAKDFDDGVSLEKINDIWRLYIHIADVSHYVRSNSEIFREAFRRGTSVYLLQNVIPMLPKLISNYICSLQAGSDKLTISVIIDFDEKFKIIRRMIYPSVIRSVARLDYDQVDDFFRNENTDAIGEEVKRVLNNMRPIAKHLTKTREERGSLNFDLPDTEIQFDENGSPTDIIRSETTESHLLIEEFMLLANQFVADIITQKCSSGIFRIHEEPDTAKLGEFSKIMKSYNYKIDFSNKNENVSLKNFLNSIKTHNEHRVFDNMLLRSMMKAEYSPINKGHFGLSLSSYTHFTSPIRRFPDLVVHHLIKQNIFEWSANKFNVDEMKKFAKNSSERELIALQAERSLGKLKKNRFMMENKDKIFDSIIVNFNSKNIFVELDKFPIQGFISLSSLNKDYYKFYKKNYTLIGNRTKRKFFLCQKVKVKVKKILHGIEFELIG